MSRDRRTYDPGVAPLLLAAAGVAAFAVALAVLRSFGPRYRVGRLLAVAPRVSVADALAAAPTTAARPAMSVRRASTAAMIACPPRTDPNGPRRAGGPAGGVPSAGHERARRNLPDTWALMRSRPLVSLSPSGLGTTLRAHR